MSSPAATSPGRGRWRILNQHDRGSHSHRILMAHADPHPSDPPHRRRAHAMASAHPYPTCFSDPAQPDPAYATNFAIAALSMSCHNLSSPAATSGNQCQIVHGSIGRRTPSTLHLPDPVDHSHPYPDHQMEMELEMAGILNIVIIPALSLSRQALSSPAATGTCPCRIVHRGGSIGRRTPLTHLTGPEDHLHPYPADRTHPAHQLEMEMEMEMAGILSVIIPALSLILIEKQVSDWSWDWLSRVMYILR